MTKKKASEKERTIESFSKDVLVEWIKRYAAFKPSINALRIIELDVEYNKLSAKVKQNMEESEKALSSSNHIKWHKLQIEWQMLQRRIDRLHKNN